MLKKQPTLLMALAMAGIVAPTANASFHDVGPVGLGDTISDEVDNGDPSDYFHLLTPHDGPMTLSYTLSGSAPSDLELNIYEGNYDGNGGISPFMTVPFTENGTLDFNPSTSDYTISINGSNFEGSGRLGYTLELIVVPIPEASTALPVIAVLGAVVALRSLKKPSSEL